MQGGGDMYVINDTTGRKPANYPETGVTFPYNNGHDVFRSGS